MKREESPQPHVVVDVGWLGPHVPPHENGQQPVSARGEQQWPPPTGGARSDGGSGPVRCRRMARRPVRFDALGPPLSRALSCSRRHRKRTPRHGSETLERQGPANLDQHTPVSSSGAIATG